MHIPQPWKSQTKTSKGLQHHPKHCHQLCHHHVCEGRVSLKSFESTSPLSFPQTHHPNTVILAPKYECYPPAHHCPYTMTSSDIIVPTTLIITTVTLATIFITTSHCHQPEPILCCHNYDQHQPHHDHHIPAALLVSALFSAE